jgi:hypothetical protein
MSHQVPENIVPGVLMSIASDLIVRVRKEEEEEGTWSHCTVLSFSTNNLSQTPTTVVDMFDIYPPREGKKTEC